MAAKGGPNVHFCTPSRTNCILLVSATTHVQREVALRLAHVRVAVPRKLLQLLVSLCPHIRNLRHTRTHTHTPRGGGGARQEHQPRCLLREQKARCAGELLYAGQPRKIRLSLASGSSGATALAASALCTAQRHTTQAAVIEASLERARNDVGPQWPSQEHARANMQGAAPCSRAGGQPAHRCFLSFFLSRGFSRALNDSDSSRKRRFSVGTKPARKMLMPSRTLKGMVTTPYAPGLPYRQQM
jgi:hypothetical protein